MRRTILLALGLLALAVIFLTCSPVYILRAGVEEAKILARRRPIPEVIADPATAPEVRRKLELVRQARTFSQHALELDVGDSYTTYSWVDRDTLTLVLSAAERTRFEPVTWWFPIVGRVPYKGFFDTSRGRAAAAELEREGYDTYLRPASAFSTLGWFNDPVLSTVLRGGDVEIVATVIHELSHNTLFIPGQVAFNESFANFVGDRGAIDFFCGIEGPAGERCRRATDLWADNLVFGSYIQSLVAALEALYARSDLSDQELLALREELFRDAGRRYAAELEPQLRTGNFRGVGQVALNNAVLMAWRLYYHRLDLFDAVYERTGRNLARAIAAVRAAADGEGDDPYGAVGAWLESAVPADAQRQTAR